MLYTMNAKDFKVFLDKFRQDPEMDIPFGDMTSAQAVEIVRVVREETGTVHRDVSARSLYTQPKGSALERGA